MLLLEDDIYHYVVVDGSVIGDATDFQWAVLARFASVYPLNIQYPQVAAVTSEFIQREIQAIHQ
jgi:hypothetical protein